MRRGMIVAVLVVAGCVTHTYAPPDVYVLAPEIGVSTTQPTDRTLGMRPLQAARPYKQAIVFRAPGHILGQYDSALWAELPSDALTRALADAIRGTGRFRDVGNAADMNAPDLILTGELRKLDEVRTTDPWTAECEVRLELREARGPEVVWAATLSATEPLAKNEVSALAAAMSRAVATVLNQAASRIAEQ